MVLNGGNSNNGVGIGDHNSYVIPGTLLHIQGAGRNVPGFGVNNQVAIGPAAANQDAGIGLLTSYAGGYAWSIRAGSGAPSANFRIYDAIAGVDRLNITHEGAVGLNTTNPQAFVHGNYGNSSPHLLILEGSNPIGSMLTLGNNSSGGKFWKMLSTGNALTNLTGQLWFAHGDTYTQVNPVLRLGIDRTAATIACDDPAGTWLNIGNSTGLYWKLISTGGGNGEGAGKLLFGWAVTPETNQTMVTMATSGLGIDTVYHPVAGVELPNKNTNIGVVRAFGFADYSSGIWKENIATLDNALDKVMALNGVTYTAKGEGNLKDCVGFIAEEVGEVMPQLVMWDEDRENAIGLFYNRVTALTVNAIKELKAEKDQELEALRQSKDAEIAALRERVDQLEQQFSALMNMLTAAGNPAQALMQTAGSTGAEVLAPANGQTSNGQILLQQSASQPVFDPSGGTSQSPVGMKDSTLEIKGLK